MGHNAAQEIFDVHIKKRKDQWENEVLKTMSAKDGICGDYGDRFIPQRNSVVNNERNLKMIFPLKVKDILILRRTMNFWRQTPLNIALVNTFNIFEHRLLGFTNNGNSNQTENSCAIGVKNTRLSGFDWACKPRSKPMAYIDSTYDSPEFSASFDHNRMDWSVREQIVASVGNDLVIWNRGENVSMAITEMKYTRCVVYSPNGDYLAIAYRAWGFPVIELWNMRLANKVGLHSGRILSRTHIDVHCMEWSKAADKIVCGTHTGIIFILAIPQLELLSKICNHHIPITKVKFSPTMPYLACGDSRGNVIIYNCHSYEECFNLRAKTKQKVYFDWHPWNGVDLAVSASNPASIAIVHVPSKKIVAFYERKDDQVSISTISFNRITAELAVCVAENDEVNECVNHRIIVLASLDRVVDTLEVPSVGTQFLKWSPDGTKVATAGKDDGLTIWSFYPEKKGKIVQLKDKCTHTSNQEDGHQHEQRLETSYGSKFKLWSCLR